MLFLSKNLENILIVAYFYWVSTTTDKSCRMFFTAINSSIKKVKRAPP